MIFCVAFFSISEQCSPSCSSANEVYLCFCLFSQDWTTRTVTSWVRSLNSSTTEAMRIKKASWIKLKQTLRKCYHQTSQELSTGTKHSAKLWLIMWSCPKSPCYVTFLCVAPSRPGASPPLPVPVVYAPPLSTMAQSQDFSYHNTDSVEVRSASTHCPPSDVPSAGGGERLESIHSFLYEEIYCYSESACVIYLYHCSYRGLVLLWNRQGE